MTDHSTEQLALFMNARDVRDYGTAAWDSLDLAGQEAYLTDATAVVVAMKALGWLEPHTSTPTPLVATLSPATDPREPNNARNGKEDHGGDREPKVAVRGTGDHQNSAEHDQDDRDRETDPSEHRLQAAYAHRSTLAETSSAVEDAGRVAEPQGEPSEVPELPDDCDCEDREALVRPEGLVCGTCGKVIAPGGAR